jgi:hypothetical protein
MNTENPKIVHNLTSLSAFGLAVCSGGLSISFGLTLADSLPLKFVFGFMLLSLAVAEFIAAFFLTKAWHSRQVIKIVLAIYLMLGGLAVSVLCGQATLQQSLDTAQQTRRLQSDVYQAAVAQRQQAAEKVAALSIDETQAVAAKNALTTLETEKQAYLASAATNSRGQSAGTIGVRVGDCLGTSYYIKKYCGKIRTLDSQIRAAKATVDKWNAYKSAKAHLDDLESKPLPNAVKDAQLPGINALALILEADGENVGAILFFLLAVFLETAAIILFVFLGTDSTAAKNSVVSATPAYIVPQPQQQPQVAQAGMAPTTPPYIVPQPQQQPQVAQAGMAPTTPPYIVPQPQQQPQVAQAGMAPTTQPYTVPQPQQPEVAQAGMAPTTQPYTVPQPQQPEVAQAGMAPTTPPYIVPQPQQQPQVAQAGMAPTTQPYTVPQPQQSQVATLSESLPQSAVPSVYQQIVDDIHAKKLRNCSFRVLMNKYGVNQNQATVIRLKLVEDGKGKFNRRHELDLV